jgi:hypothetical protein
VVGESELFERCNKLVTRVFSRFMAATRDANRSSG